MEALNAGGIEAQVRTLYSVVAHHYQDALLRLSPALRGTNPRSGTVDLWELPHRLSGSVRLGVLLVGSDQPGIRCPKDYGKIMHMYMRSRIEKIAEV